MDLRLFAVDKLPEEGKLVQPKHVGVDPEYGVSFAVYFIVFRFVHFGFLKYGTYDNARYEKQNSLIHFILFGDERNKNLLNIFGKNLKKFF